jgi:CCR4-NOT transcription complex subunit 7/8
MMKRLSLLLAALFVASMVLVGPVFASGNHENNNGGDNEKVCVLHKDKGDEHNNGEHKDYRWVSKDDKHHGDKVVKDKFCEHRNTGEHKYNNGEHRNNGEHKDNNGEHKDKNGEHKDNGDNNNDNGHANNNDDNGHTNNNDDDWS